MNVHPSKKSKLILVTTSDKNNIKASEEFLLKLGFSNEIVIQENENGIPENAVSIVVDNIKAFLPWYQRGNWKIEKRKSKIRIRSNKRRKNAFKSRFYK